MAQSPHLSRSEARKAELVSELEWSRARLSTNLKDTLDDLNVVDHLRHSIVEHKTSWFTGAAVTGGLLSWVFGRKKKPKPSFFAPPPAVATVKIPQNTYTGIALAALTFLFNLAKPLLSSMASRKISELAARNSHH